MSGWPRIYYKLLNLPLSILVKSKSIPAEPAQELGLDTSRPIMYVLPYNSKADLLTLRAQCLAHDLPDPLEPLEIDGTLLPRYVFIHGGPRVFTYYTPKEEFYQAVPRLSRSASQQSESGRADGAGIGDVWSSSGA